MNDISIIIEDKETKKMHILQKKITRTGYYKYNKSNDHLLKFSKKSKREVSKKTCIKKNIQIFRVNCN